MIVAIGICEIAGAVGSLFTVSQIPVWYSDLIKPPFNPPSWVFGPVWTTLYILMGLSLFIIWEKTDSPGSKKAILVFLLQLSLNSLWSLLFFGMHNPSLAFVEIVVLWLSILWTIIEFKKISKPAAWLLVPYLAWVTFASYLNLAVAILN